MHDTMTAERMEAGVQVLRRMTGRRGAVDTGAPSATDGFVAALLRAGQGIAGLEIEVSGAGIGPVTAAEVTTLAPEHALVVALARDAGPAAGAMILSAPALAALVEAITTGAPGRHGLDPRRPTRTDAALVASFVDAVLAALSANASVPAAPWRFGTHLPDTRPLALMLADAELTLSQADLLFAGGRRQGTLWLVLPHDPPATGDEPEDAAAGFDLAVRLDAAEVRMDAVLARLQMPLAHLMALSGGEVLVLQGASLDGVRLTGVDGRLIGEGRLGQVKGQRALRLTHTLAAPQDTFSRVAG